ncbi:hypothetical protein NPIL_394081 [Nephila pilipes]|uniref:Integrase catalytic domain-containing protein n=1 Tax=Nephila pilipes TaxID=299642 RepID=A0A8X6QXM3_NEPPI|nr:hypothetical protein NPIL_394081 [Nephila pilipes]
MIDNATLYVFALSSTYLASYTVTDALYHNIILGYAPLSMYLSDKKTMCIYCAPYLTVFAKIWIKQSMTPTYSPQANRTIERSNRIIGSTLNKLIGKNPEIWDLLLPNDLLEINAT